jgi:5'-nucleotidase
MNSRPFVLITNDDGVEAEGIIRLVEAFAETCTITVMAPEGARSGMSAALTCDKPITYTKISENESITIYSCSGTPVDCVKLALDKVVSRKPDLILSGINHGGNHALSIHYSGTMGAAFEGCVFDVPSIGISLFDYSEFSNFNETCRIALTVANRVLEHGLPHGTYLNLNVPDVAHVKGIKIGRQTDGKWVNEYRVEKEKNGKVKYWLTGEYEVFGQHFQNNDLQILKDDFASLVPCKIDVTDYSFADEMKRWKW